MIGRHHLKSGRSLTPAPCQHAWVCASCRKCSNVLQTLLRAAVWTRTLFNDVNHRGSWADSHAIKGTGGGGVWIRQTPSRVLQRWSLRSHNDAGTTLRISECNRPDLCSSRWICVYFNGITRRKDENEHKCYTVKANGNPNKTMWTMTLSRSIFSSFSLNSFAFMWLLYV